MSEIKPVYQRYLQFNDWEDISEEEFNREWTQSKYKTRILYHAAAYEALQKENAELKAEDKLLEAAFKLAHERHQAESAAHAKRIEEAVSRIKDMLENDDGQAHKEARKFIESLAASKNGE